MRRFLRNLEPVEKFMILVIVVGLIVIACIAAARSGEKQAQMSPSAEEVTTHYEMVGGSYTLPRSCTADASVNRLCPM